MWGDAMKIIEQWLPDVDFSRPAADEITGLLVEIPSTYGMSIDQATCVLEDAGFTVVGRRRDRLAARPGADRRQLPALGQQHVQR